MKMAVICLNISLSDKYEYRIMNTKIIVQRLAKVVGAKPNKLCHYQRG